MTDQTPMPATEGLQVSLEELPADYTITSLVEPTEEVTEEPEKELMDLCFIDSETISLRADENVIWEFAAIKVDQRTGEEKGTLWFQRECDLGEADPFSLKIGNYHDRYGKNGVWKPDFDELGRPIGFPSNGEVVTSDFDAAYLIAEFTRGTSLLGLVVSFDSERMERFLRSNYQCPGWHYHVLDLEPLCVGYLKAMGNSLTIPYRSEEISAMMGVDTPTDEDRHTALGDARWVQRLWTAASV